MGEEKNKVSNIDKILKCSKKYKTIIEIFLVIIGVFVAIMTLNSIDDQVKSAVKQTELSQLQIENSSKQTKLLQQQIENSVNQTKLLQQQIENSINQTKLMGKQVESSIKQTETIIRQTEATWYTNRPIIKLSPITPNKDIKTYPLDISLEKLKMFKNSDSVFCLNVSIDNQGNSSAYIDSIKYSFIYDKKSSFSISGESGLSISSTKGISVPLPIPFTKVNNTDIKVDIIYSWNNKIFSNKLYILTHYYRVFYENDNWRVLTILPIEFNSIRKNVLEHTTFH